MFLLSKINGICNWLFHLCSKIPQLAEVLNLRMLLVIENWRKSLHVGDADTAPTAVCEGPNSVTTGTAIPEAFKEQMMGQINRVLQLEHPVYKVMCNSSYFKLTTSMRLLKYISRNIFYKMSVSRALGFLRSTLSAKPPNPIPLPTGFGALSESAKFGSASQPSVPLDPSVCALEKPSINRRPDMVGDSNFVASNTASEPNSSPNPTDLSRTYDLALIASRLMPLVVHNRHVFGPHYAEIIHDLLKPSTPSG